MSYKYDFDTKVKARRELTIPTKDEETGEEYDIVIPEGTEGIITSMGRSSTYGFAPMYDVDFYPDGSINDITFIESDLEDACIILSEKGADNEQR